MELPEPEGWEFVVEDVIHITNRGDYAIGQIRQGTVRPQDRFVSEHGESGTVMAIEMLDRADRSSAVALRTEATLRPGDLLRHEPAGERA